MIFLQVAWGETRGGGSGMRFLRVRGRRTAGRKTVHSFGWMAFPEVFRFFRIQAEPIRKTADPGQHVVRDECLRIAVESGVEGTNTNTGTGTGLGKEAFPQQGLAHGICERHMDQGMHTQVVV